MEPSSPAAVDIEFRSVTKRFGGVTALENVSLSILAGECHALCGENGAGKSTLMKILSGVHTDFEGELFVHGKSARFQRTTDAEQCGIAIIHQELNLVAELSAAANMFLGRELRNSWGLLDNATMEQRAGEILRELECEVSPRQLVKSLRIGDQQLVEIGKALLHQSQILIMDEPTSALTETEVARLNRVIQRLRDRGVTLVYISHKMDEVFHLANRITVLRDGKTITTVDRQKTSPREVTHWMVGRDIETREFQRSQPPGDVQIEVQKLFLPWPDHPRQWRLNNISFQVRRGEVVGLAGLMGAGRTELLEVLYGASQHAPTGQILWQGQPVAFRHPSQALAAGIALVTEDRKQLGLFPQLNVREQITLSSLRQVTTCGFVQSSRERVQATAAIEQFRIKTGSPEANIGSLSGGNQQKCLIARALQSKPKLLLLDDPTRGVDVGAKAEIYGLIESLCADGLAILVTSSELPELMTLCDRILVLCEGQLTAEFARPDFREQAIIEAATHTTS